MKKEREKNRHKPRQNFFEKENCLRFPGTGSAEEISLMMRFKDDNKCHKKAKSRRQSCRPGPASQAQQLPA